jgi:hypothetical protein
MEVFIGAARLSSGALQKTVGRGGQGKEGRELAYSFIKACVETPRVSETLIPLNGNGLTGVAALTFIFKDESKSSVIIFLTTVVL